MLVFTASPFSESCKDCMDCLLSNCAKTVEIIVVRVWKGSFLRYNQCFTYLLTQKSDWNSISPYNITPKSNIKVMGIKEMITN